MMSWSFQGLFCAYFGYPTQKQYARRDIYSDTIRVKAISIVLSQIGGRQTLHLVKCLNKWPPVEIRIFVSDLINMLNPLQYVLFRCRPLPLFAEQIVYRLKSGEMSSPVRAYKNALAPSHPKNHSLMPFVGFLLDLAKTSDTAGDAILDSGAMNFLLHLCISDFRDFLATNLEYSDTSGLPEACYDLLRTFLTTSRGLETFRAHPIHIVSPVQPGISGFIDNCMTRRARMWNLVTSEITLWRIRTMLKKLLANGRIIEEDFLLEFAADIIELSG